MFYLNRVRKLNNHECLEIQSCNIYIYIYTNVCSCKISIFNRVRYNSLYYLLITFSVEKVNEEICKVIRLEMWQMTLRSSQNKGNYFVSSPFHVTLAKQSMPKWHVLEPLTKKINWRLAIYFQKMVGTSLRLKINITLLNNRR